MGMALHGLGNPVWGIECDPEIAKVYKANHPHSNLHLDYAENVIPYSLEDVDCIIATPPCIRASVANPKARESDIDISIGQSIVNIIKAKLPKFFILENVEGYRNFESFDSIKSNLNLCGYYNTICKFNLKDFGIAQNRERLYLVAARHKFFFEPQALFSKKQGWYEAIEDLIPELPETTFAKYQQKCKGISKKCLIRRIGANEGNNRAYQPHEPSFTIRAHGRKSNNHWNQANVLINEYPNFVVKSVTPRACLRLFGNKETADKIWLPERKTLAMEVVGNGASWEIMKFLLAHISQ